MLAALTNTDIGLFVAGSIVVPYFVYIHKALQALKTKSDGMDNKLDELVDAHAPGPDGIMEWKNPEIRELSKAQVQLLMDIKEILSTSHSKLAQLFQGQSEVKQSLQQLRRNGD